MCLSVSVRKRSAANGYCFSSNRTENRVVSIHINWVSIELLICLKGNPKEEKEQSSDVRLGRITGEILRSCLRDGPSAAEGVEGMQHHRYSIRRIPVATTVPCGRIGIEDVEE